jgi:iron complex outermembrane receptor protein
MSLEDLMKLEVTSVSKTPQRLFDTPSAIYSISNEEIRRSGLQTLPEVLRLAPGVGVAQADANKWAITTRGFNDYYSNKQLVLIDGRSIYTPNFSGVFWDQQDILMEDVERVEVIRGPGASIWGANAVNGTINVISKTAKETQGGYLSVSAGNHDLPRTALRYGDKIGQNLYYRVYGTWNNTESYPNSVSGYGADDWSNSRLGTRFDWDLSENDLVTVSAEYFRVHDGTSQTNPIDLNNLTPLQRFALLSTGLNTHFNDSGDSQGGHFLAKWTHDEDVDTHTTLQAYYDTSEVTKLVEFGTDNKTMDVEFTQTALLFDSNKIITGGGYRWISAYVRPGPTIRTENEIGDDHQFNYFVQDEIAVVPDKLFITLGTKLEHFINTGFEVEPTFKLLGKPTENQTLWGSVSRAVRTPAIYDTNSVIHYKNINVGVPAELIYFGNKDFKSESLLAFEGGYRIEPTASVYVDTTVFYNIYDDLRTGTFPMVGPNPDPTPFPPVPTAIGQLVNNKHGASWGGETSVTYTPLDNWKLIGSYSFNRIDLNADFNSIETAGKTAPTLQDPQHKFQIRSQLDLPHNVMLDGAVYYTDKLASGNAPSYVRLDLRLAWKPTAACELSLVGQNLTDPQHKEFGSGDSGQVYSEIPRTFYGKLALRF